MAKMAAFEELLSGMIAGREWGKMGDREGVQELMQRVYRAPLQIH